MDKQSWQRVNQIRVAGSGNTNYAIIKDDIGNWNVKGYSADPESIFQGAKSMALFAASGQLGTNMIKFDKDLQDARKEDPNAAAPQIKTQSSQQRQLDSLQQDYETQLTADYKAIREKAASLSGRVNQVWTTDPAVSTLEEDARTRLLAVLEGPGTQLAGAIPADEAITATVQDREQAVDGYIDLLNAMRRFYIESSNGLTTVELITTDTINEIRSYVRVKEIEVARLETKHAEATKNVETEKAQLDALNDAVTASPGNAAITNLRDVADRDHKNQLAVVNESSNKLQTAQKELSDLQQQLASEERKHGNANLARLSAQRSLTFVIREIILPLIERRLTTTRNQQTAVSVIGTH